MCNDIDQCPAGSDTDADSNGFPDACDVVLCSAATDKVIADPHQGALRVEARLNGVQNMTTVLPDVGLAFTVATQSGSPTPHSTGAETDRATSLTSALNAGGTAVWLQTVLTTVVSSAYSDYASDQQPCAASGRTIRRYVHSGLVEPTLGMLHYVGRVEVRGF